MAYNEKQKKLRCCKVIKGVSSVKRRSLEFRECASQPKAHDALLTAQPPEALTHQQE